MDERTKNASYDHIFAVSLLQPSFKDLDSPEDDAVIVINESDEDEPNAETEDTSVPRSSSLRSSQIQELTNQVLILQSQKHKLEPEKNKAEAEAALLKAHCDTQQFLDF
nr:hypothetical protein [Tanacetum cinerariifolium]